MRYPHPVLGPTTGDYTSGKFDLTFRHFEDSDTGALTLQHEITLTEPGLKNLIVSGQAAVGCFVRCNDTYFAELRELAWWKGRSDFSPGKLLNRVSLRPVIWVRHSIKNWNPGSIHEEFDPPVNFEAGDIVAVGDEFIISVGQSKLTPIESIFELDRSSQVTEGQLQVVLNGDRIRILAAPKTYETISLLRNQALGRPVVMNAIYLPAVMEVLDSLRDAPDQYDGRRWFQPFMSKCDAKGIDPGADGSSILDDAQRLLESPTAELEKLVTGEGD